MPGPTDIILIRHAPARTGGRLVGRGDVAADLPGPEALARARARVGAVAQLIASPARRCRMTAGALFPGLTARTDERLWEQDFGAWEGLAPTDLPDLGALSKPDLAAHRPPDGESFRDLCARVGPALIEAGSAAGPVVVVAHAGTVRAALALATRALPAALAFDVAPFSATRIRAHPGGEWSVLYVNRLLT